MEDKKLIVTLSDGVTKIEADTYDYVVQYYAGGWKSYAVFGEFLKANTCRKELENKGYKHTQIIQLY